MFALRSLFWLGTVVMLLPPAVEGGSAPRVNAIQAAYAFRTLMQDLTGVCDRNPAACATSRDALVLVGKKLETGAGVVTAGLAAGQAAAVDTADHGTLTPADMDVAWSLPER